MDNEIRFRERDEIEYVDGRRGIVEEFYHGPTSVPGRDIIFVKLYSKDGTTEVKKFYDDGVLINNQPTIKLIKRPQDLNEIRRKHRIELAERMSKLDPTSSDYLDAVQEELNRVSKELSSIKEK